MKVRGTETQVLYLVQVFEIDVPQGDEDAAIADPEDYYHDNFARREEVGSEMTPITSGWEAHGLVEEGGLSVSLVEDTDPVAEDRLIGKEMGL